MFRLFRDNLNLLNVNPSFSKFEISFLTFTLKNLSSSNIFKNCNKKGGKIINISSWAGKSFVQPNYGAYSTSKFAIRGLTQVLAKELGPHGIQVNAICPGAVITERTKKLAKALAPKGTKTNKAIKNYISERLTGTPLGRLCTTNDIAQITAFLVSSESDFINGKSITLDGGKTTD